MALPHEIHVHQHQGFSKVPQIARFRFQNSELHSPSMMKHSKADNLDLLFSLHSSLAFASRSSPAIVNKLVQGQGEIFSKKNCSSDYHTKTSASLASPIRFSRMNLPPVSVPPFPIVPTIKTSALIFRHPLCNLQLH